MKEADRFRPLRTAFYDADPEDVAPRLLGAILVRCAEDGVTVGRIVETEAYQAVGDPACHASRGRTRKNASMFGPPGHAYVYPIHARHCFNVVTEPAGRGSAVLIRAVEPLEGTALMAERRGTGDLANLARGPARLCEAFAIDRNLDGWNLAAGESLWICAAPKGDGRRRFDVGTSPRIGVTSGGDLALRFYLRGCRFVSGPRRLNG